MSIFPFNIEICVKELLHTFNHHRLTKSPKCRKLAKRIELLRRLGYIQDAELDLSFDVAEPERLDLMGYLETAQNRPKKTRKHRSSNGKKPDPIKTEINAALTKIVVNTPGYYEFAKQCFREIALPAIAEIVKRYNVAPQSLVPIYKGSTEIKDYLRKYYREENLAGLYDNSDVDTCIMIYPDLENYEVVRTTLIACVYKNLIKVAKKYQDVFTDMFRGTTTILDEVYATPGVAQNFVQVGEFLNYAPDYTYTRCYQIDVRIDDSEQFFNLSRIKIPFDLCGPNMSGVKTLCGEFLDISIIHKSTMDYREQVRDFF